MRHPVRSRGSDPSFCFGFLFCFSLFRAAVMKATLEAAGEAIVAGVPLHRIGSPEDVAGTCIFLSSRAGSYVNGATITLDGGSVVSAKL